MTVGLVLRVRWAERVRLLVARDHPAQPGVGPRARRPGPPQPVGVSPATAGTRAALPARRPAGRTCEKPDPRACEGVGRRLLPAGVRPPEPRAARSVFVVPASRGRGTAAGTGPALGAGARVVQVAHAGSRRPRRCSRRRFTRVGTGTMARPGGRSARPCRGPQPARARPRQYTARASEMLGVGAGGTRTGFPSGLRRGWAGPVRSHVRLSSRALRPARGRRVEDASSRCPRARGCGSATRTARASRRWP